MHSSFVFFSLSNKDSNTKFKYSIQVIILSVSTIICNWKIPLY